VSGYDDFGLGLHLGAGGQIWVSAASRLGHVHGVTSVKPGGDLLVELAEHLYDLLDAIRFAEAFDAKPITEALGTIAFGESVVRELFQGARGAAADRGRQLVVRIQASPQLSSLPWELLPDPSLTLSGPGIRHLTLSPDVHVVRLSRGRTYPISSEPVEPPLNLLVVLSSPMGEKAGDDSLTFDIYEAKRNLLGELMALEDSGWLNIDVEDRPTMDNLRRRIRSKRRGYQLLHYLGHAEPDLLLLENDHGRRRDVRGVELVDWLRTCPDLRLVTFAGCETARPAGDPSSLPDSTDWQDLLSLAERAAQGSSPVVLGMQAVLPFRTEWLLTRSLYQALASGNTIVDAVRLARSAVRSDEGVNRGLLDWAIPALFMNSMEPASLLDHTSIPPAATRRRSNVAKLEPPTAGAGLVGRDVALRQAVEVLSGRTRQRVLLISGAGGARASELLDRALDEIDGDVSDILSVSYLGLTDELEAKAFLIEEEGELPRDAVIRANLCASVSQLLERSDNRSRERRPGWTLRRWWAWLAEDLAGRRAVLAIDRIGALELASRPLRILAQEWLYTAYPAELGRSPEQLAELADFIEHLRNPDEEKPSRFAELLSEFDAFLEGPTVDLLAREILADETEELFDLRLIAGRAAKGEHLWGNPDPPRPADSIEQARRELADVRGGFAAVGDMLTRLVRRSDLCRVALVVDEAPQGLLREVDELVFPMRLGESTWPETWRWVRRSLPGLGRFGRERLKGVWRKYLGSDIERWEELERRVLDGMVAAGVTSSGDDIAGLENPETDLERLAIVICARGTRPRPTLIPDEEPWRRPRRRDRPLVVASASMGEDESTSASRLSFHSFQSRLNALAEAHGIGGRVTTTTVNQLDTLAVLAHVPTPFRWDGSARDVDISTWIWSAAQVKPDIVLLDFAGDHDDEAAATRRWAFPAHRTLQIAAGGNTGTDIPIWPAWDPDVLAVGALDEDGRIRNFSTKNRRSRKPDIFATDAFDPGDPRMGTSFSAAYVAVAAILVWTLLPDRTPQGLRRFLLNAATPIEPRRGQRWPLALDLDAALAAARRERVISTLRRGRASLQAVVAMTGLDWQWAETTLDELAALDQVAMVPAARDVVYELVDRGQDSGPQSGRPAR
jgi:hypothetical protein